METTGGRIIQMNTSDLFFFLVHGIKGMMLSKQKQSILQVEQTTNTRRNDLRRAYNRHLLFLRAGGAENKITEYKIDKYVSLTKKYVSVLQKLHDYMVNDDPNQNFVRHYTGPSVKLAKEGKIPQSWGVMRDAYGGMGSISDGDSAEQLSMVNELCDLGKSIEAYFKK